MNKLIYTQLYFFSEIPSFFIKSTDRKGLEGLCKHFFKLFSRHFFCLNFHFFFDKVEKFVI